MDKSTAANATAALPPLPVVDTGMSVLTTLGYLCLLLGIIFLAYWLLKRLGIQGVGMRSGRGGPQLLSRMMLGTRQSLIVVRYRERDLLVGVTEQNITLISEDLADENIEISDKPLDFSSLIKRRSGNDA